jgi:hypothetical protein
MCITFVITTKLALSLRMKNYQLPTPNRCMCIFYGMQAIAQGFTSSTERLRKQFNKIINQYNVC